MSIRFRLGPTYVTSLAVTQWANRDGNEEDATTLGVEVEEVVLYVRWQLLGPLLAQ